MRHRKTSHFLLFWPFRFQGHEPGVELPGNALSVHITGISAQIAHFLSVSVLPSRLRSRSLARDSRERTVPSAAPVMAAISRVE